MDNSTKITLRGITKTFGSLKVNDNIDLDIKAGEFLTLLGSSGSGKTTLMRIVAGLESCDSGTVCVDGRDVTHLPPRKRNVAMVFQQYSLFPHMTVNENICYGLKVKGWKADKMKLRAAEMLEMIRLPEVADRYPNQLSGGQQQRVALARALATSPDVLMLDEPLGALDLKLRKQLQVELKRIHKKTGTTFLFVTHDQDEALSMSDRIAVLRNGRIEQLDRADMIYERPATSFVADFIGEISLLNCVGEGQDDWARIDQTGFRLRVPEAPGGKFRLAVRPEHVFLHNCEKPDAYSACVREVHFAGGSSILEVALDGGVIVKARVLGMPSRSMQPGCRVWVELKGNFVAFAAT
ncbi:ABC transporter ATP-binding protein [Pusillimonas caeni]|uniref:ABC transporter ATP-binding protein n=1 Tax=Pusillimonas caeni TaxID=1348472 RepID=UPI000E59B381|nr:ABC transporter ATP-binding protein [Pusillimonas caeni]TFL15568.1 ABC transporter ATP-binding protein [Pusillimonas caeni]